MRTTISLDDDVADEIDRELRRRPKSSYNEVVNDLIRAGLHARRKTKCAPKFKVRARSLGLPSGLNYDGVGGLLEELEGAMHR